MRILRMMRWGLLSGLIAATLIVGHVRTGQAADPVPGAASATDAPDDASQGGTVVRAFDQFVVKGGWVTWLMLIPLSVLVLAMGIQSAFAVRRSRIIPEESVRRLRELIGQRRYADALAFSAGDPSIISYVMHAGLSEAAHGYAAMERTMEEAVEERAARLMRRIEYLNLIGNVAPMIGLFGTVVGIIGMFVSIAESGGIPVVSKISDDLGTALVATFWGLLIAIPTLSAFGILRNRIDVLMEECAVSAGHLLAVFRPQPAESPRSASVPATPFAVPVPG